MREGSRAAYAASGSAHHRARASADHEEFVHRPGIRIVGRDRSGLLADRGELSIVAGSLHHHHRLPGALAGICWMLLITHTTLNVPSLTGAIMCMGVATANSILMVSFAREQLDEGKSPLDAAIEAGFVRMRPVVMTALAMIIGMVPMAIGLGEGGEQNAPLGRAVIGGLLFATFATLFFVPCVFSMIHGYLEKRKAHGKEATA